MTKSVVKRLLRFSPLVLVLVLPYLWVSNCSGPRPSVSGLQVQPPQTPDGPYTLSALVTNNGPGHGQVDVTFRLRDQRSGHTFEQDETVTLEAGEQAEVSVEINAPPGNYMPEVEVEYPPR
ncbi:MAG TPA: hypothetical protein VFU69_02770 [Ktedonobacterales bacterium]|nr:hypothetical protein [Ktedonobacterales bacterium]